MTARRSLARHRSCAAGRPAPPRWSAGMPPHQFDGAQSAGWLDVEALQHRGAIDVRRRRWIGCGEITCQRRCTLQSGDHQRIAPLRTDGNGDHTSLHCLIENRGLGNHDVVLNVADKLRQNQDRGPLETRTLARRTAPCRRRPPCAAPAQAWCRRQRRGPPCPPAPAYDGGQRQSGSARRRIFIAAVIQLIQDKTPQLGAGCVVRGCDPTPARLWQWRPAATPRTPG